LQAVQGRANVAVLKALVTQASSAIPLMPLYLSILIKIMKEEGTNEHCIEQIQRLFSECIYSNTPRIDSAQRYRVDEKELEPNVQAQVEAAWAQVTEENLLELTDYRAYNADFLKLFGFGLEGIDYEADVNPSLVSLF
jgi:enoyl-[acyl-carrier protein] reductase/trans-2-enoyl-CoA reductase (NAD+)